MAEPKIFKRGGRFEIQDGSKTFRFPEGTESGTVLRYLESNYPQFAIRVPLLEEGQEITEEGPKFELVGLGDQRITEEQRTKILKDFEAGKLDKTAAPGTKTNPFVTRVQGETSARAPVGAMVVAGDGTTFKQRPKKNQTLGFTTGTRRAALNVGSALNIPGARDFRERENQMIARARAAGQEPGIVGDAVGTTIGTYPFVFATRNPGVGGAIAGGVNTTGDTPGEVAVDTAVGAVGGKAVDKLFDAAGAVIAPKLDPFVKELLDQDVPLTPGQIVGGTTRTIEDTAATFPVVGDIINAARGRGLDSFNRVAVNRALEPISRSQHRRPFGLRGRTESTPVAPGTPAIGAGASTANQAISPPDNVTRLPAPTAEELASPEDVLAFRRSLSDDANSRPDLNGSRPVISSDDVDRPRLPVAPEDFRSTGTTTPRVKTAPEGQVTRGNLEDAFQGAGAASADDIKRTFDDFEFEGIDTKLPKNVKTGYDAINFAYETVDAAYNQVKKKLSFRADNQFKGEFSNVLNDVKNLRGQERDWLINNLRDRWLNKGGAFEMGGEEFKQLDSWLSSNIRSFSSSTDAFQRETAAIMRDAQIVLRQSAARQNPSAAQALLNVDEAYSKLLRIGGAASHAAAEGGVFTPQMLKSASRQLDESLRKNKFARGKAIFQDFSDKATTTLGQSINESQVPTRGILTRIGGLSLGGGTVATGFSGFNPMVAGTIAAPLLAFTRPGARAIQAALTKRPPGAEQLRGTLDQVSPALIPTAVTDINQAKDKAVR